jgi:hypothetical protein
MILPILVVLAASVLCAQTKSASHTTTQAPETTATNFYRWYLKSLRLEQDPFNEGSDTLKKFVSTKLIHEIKEKMKREGGLEEDYFIQAQDWSQEWENKIAVGKASIKNHKATTIVSLDAVVDEKQKLKITMIMESGTWKIRSVVEIAH